MEKQEFTPQESIQLISSVIQEARTRFVEDGIMYLFWGMLLIAVSLGQFILIQMGKPEISYYPYFLIPFGFMYSGYYHSRSDSKVKTNNRITKLISQIWMILGINMMIMGFALALVLKGNLIPFFLILSGIGASISGFTLQAKVLVYAGFFSNFIGFLCFFAPLEYHSLIFAVTALFSYIAPGWWLRKKFIQNNEI